MSILVDEPGSPGWWLQRAHVKLRGRQKDLQALRDRQTGDAPLPAGPDNVREAYRTFQKESRTNWSDTIVTSATDRMRIVGFKTAAADDRYGDELAKQIWDGNGLNVESDEVHDMMIGMGDAYTIVGEAGEGEVPPITAEDPREVVTFHDPVQQRNIRAAAKFFHDADESVDYGFLYLPGEVHVAVHEVRRLSTTHKRAVAFTPSRWDWERVDLLADPDRMPVVRFRNRHGVGDFEMHTDLLDRIDRRILQQLVISAMQSFRQRALKGKLPTHDNQGREIDYDDVFSADPGALWELPEGVELWESSQTDLRPILDAAKEDLKTLAAVTSTPLTAVMPDLTTQSAEGAVSLKEALIFRVENRQGRAGEGWKDTIAQAFSVMGDTGRADRSKLEVMWAPAERHSLGERYDAYSKSKGVPFRYAAEHILDFSPSQVDEMEQLRAADQVIAAALSDTPAA